MDKKGLANFTFKVIRVVGCPTLKESEEATEGAKYVILPSNSKDKQEEEEEEEIEQQKPVDNMDNDESNDTETPLIVDECVDRRPWTLSPPKRTHSEAIQKDQASDLNPIKEESPPAEKIAPNTGSSSGVSGGNVRRTYMDSDFSDPFPAKIGRAEDWAHFLDSSPSGSPSPSPSPLLRAALTKTTKPAAMARSKPVQPKFQLPKVAARLLSVLFFLHTPGLILDSPRGPDCVANLWYHILKDIKDRQKRSEKIPLLERRLWAEHRGFYYQHKMVQFEEYLRSFQTRSKRVYRELFPLKLAMVTLPHYCPSCEVLHFFAPSCTSRLRNGPLITGNLRHNPHWKTDIKAVIIGTESLFYSYHTKKYKTVNLGIDQTLDYWVPDQLSEHHMLFTEPMVEEDTTSAYGHILEKLRLIGLASKIPVFIEFFFSKDNTSAWYLQIIGFMHVVKSLQKAYQGPLIAVVGPSKFLPNEPEKDYIDRKQRMFAFNKLLKLIGLCYGVPIGVIPVQRMPDRIGEEIIIEGWWRDEPIHSSTGRATREYFRRIQVWLDEAIQFLNADV